VIADRLVSFAGGVLDRKMSRRSLLRRMAVGGSALAVAPVRYLLRPGTAEALVNCVNCNSGSRCCDGYTEFCCTINDGLNACPTNTFIGGWWKCTNYTGAGACHKEGVRFYIDCNIKPGRSCTCHCAKDKCSNRRTCCNAFRYGQCNTQITEVTPIVCRVIKCKNPCDIYSFCTCTYKEDDNTCAHEANCLAPYSPY
jgi:hypothetical protein